MSKRTEALEEINTEIQVLGGYVLSRSEQVKVMKCLRAATDSYHIARKNALMFDQASAYGIAVWGSKGIKPSSRYGKLVRDFVQRTVEKNNQDEDGQTIPIRIVTGGGHGIMEAANYGAHRAQEKGRNQGIQVTVVNYGVPIRGFSKAEDTNRFVINNNGEEEEHPEFSTRKQRMLDLTRGAFIAAGGYGTLYEALMAIQNKQTGHIEPDYLIVAHRFWQDNLELIYDRLYHSRKREKQIPLINEEDLRLVQFVKKPDEAIEIFTPSIRHWWREIGSKVSWIE